MNIQLFSHNGNLEGAPIFLTTLAEKLQQDGHDCHITLSSEGILEKRIIDSKVDHTVIENVFFDPSLLKTDSKPDLVIVNTILGFRIVKHFAKSSARVIWIIHESDLALMGSDVTAEHFTMADVVVFPSEFAKKRYASYDQGNFVVIPNGIATDAIGYFRSKNTKQQLRQQYNIPDDATVFLSVGIHDPLKGFSTCVQSTIALIEQNPDANIHLVIAGGIRNPEQQMNADKLLQAAWKHNVRNRIHVYADFPQINDLFGLADCYLCASALETFPLTILEAMAFNLPIIASNTGGIPEQITDRIDGILIKPQNKKQLTAAMQNILSNPEVALSLGDAAHKTCTKAFTDDRMMREYTKIFDVQYRAPKLEVPASTEHCHLNQDHDISLMMRASKPDTIRDAVNSAIASFPYYKEFVIGVSPTLDNETLEWLKAIPHVRIVPGTNEREKAAALHFTLLSACKHTWIVNVDDDDLWVFAPNLDTVTDDIGIIHGTYFYLNTYLPYEHARRYVLEVGHPVSCSEHVNGIAGSNWIMRRAAWRSVSSNLTEDTPFQNSDWSMYYYLLENNWKAIHTQRIMGFEQRFSYDFTSGPGSTWADTFALLQSRSS